MCMWIIQMDPKGSSYTIEKSTNPETKRDSHLQVKDGEKVWSGSGVYIRIKKISKFPSKRSTMILPDWHISPKIWGSGIECVILLHLEVEI